MQLHKIDSIAALREEKQRLQAEAKMAKHFLAQKTQQTIWNGKMKVSEQLSWPNLLQTGLKVGLGAAVTRTLAASSSNSPTWLKGIQEGLAIAESDDPQKWMKLIPVALDIWQSSAQADN